MTLKHSCFTNGFILAVALLVGGNALAQDADDDDVPVTTPKGPPPDDFVNPNDAADLAYEVVPVANGGTLRGTISYTGDVPEAKRFKVEKTPEICGEEDRFIQEVKAVDGHLAGTVVLFEEVAAGKPFHNEVLMGPPPGSRAQEATSDSFMGTTLRPEKCIFGAYTSVFANTSVIRFDNQDPVKHSPHTYEVRGVVRDTLHNQDLEGNGFLKLGINLTKGTEQVIKLECDQHEHMQNFFRRVTNPYYAFSGADGSYEIDQIPPGTYNVIVWHPKLGEKNMEVIIAAGATASADFTLEEGGGRRRRRR